MKLLITGGTGFLGRRACGYFASLGWQVLAPGREEVDLTEEASVRTWFSRNLPEAVIHTAAISDTGLCQRQPEWSERINVTAAVNLAKVCREYGVKLVMCSSDQVYSGSPEPGPHREGEVLKPNNVYGCQKLRAEQLCLAVFPRTVCLRLSWMYSVKDLPGDHGHFLTALKAAMAEEAGAFAWPVHDRRGLTDVDTVVQNLPAALQLEGGCWNFGSENESSTYATVKAVLEQLDMAPLLARLKPNEAAFAENPRDITMDIGKTSSEGIFFPTTKEGLTAALKKLLA